MIRASHTALAQICATLADRDSALYVAPASMFLPFAAVSQYLRTPPTVQHAWIRSGLQLAGEVLGTRTSAAQYGKGRKCSAVTVEMAQKALELAKRDADATNLVVDRKAARDKLIAKALLEFCVMAKILEPVGLEHMISCANELTAGVLQSGWLTRNEIRIKG